MLVQVSTTDSEVSRAADFAAEQLSSQSNSLSPLKVEEVLSARSKVAAGKVFELKMKLSQGNMPEQIMQASLSLRCSTARALMTQKSFPDHDILPSCVFHGMMCACTESKINGGQTCCFRHDQGSRLWV